MDSIYQCTTSTNMEGQLFESNLTHMLWSGKETAHTYTHTYTHAHTHMHTHIVHTQHMQANILQDTTILWCWLHQPEASAGRDKFLAMFDYNAKRNLNYNHDTHKKTTTSKLQTCQIQATAPARRAPGDTWLQWLTSLWQHIHMTMEVQHHPLNTINKLTINQAEINEHWLGHHKALLLEQQLAN
jgi:hypothetical protein